MLTVNIICLGKLKETYWRQACDEYAKRLRAFCKFQIIELAECKLPDHPSQAQIDEALKKEGEAVLMAAAGSVIVPLCIEGREISSAQLADKLASFALNGASAVSFVIGSSFGLNRQVKDTGVFCLSMSPMTFPHQLARVMLCEQIYRAFQINHNGKYHK